ncbi:ParB/RepB/Spo0J family partition protein [Cupriavidus oxalaticus]|uniref:ParB/RepB/Spo0J family partition protein n=1 Tax=Cupriavidus oxalaticus TaxID=96344 RepID=A0A4P7LPZ1_9BURK|nr:ParB/RepB/Spo0J family partition protein [Cupriavidus oxalaticus]QBY54451.1 ParB/RepB/Spo0J family partition protein [Cupriavidus oxalaticus]
MSKFKDVRELPLEQLEIGKAQVRVRDVGRDIDELAASINKVGLLEPIVVCEVGADKYEIITGQRRFLAHQRLKAKTILSAILKDRVDETAAKILSVTENLVRRDLNSRDLIDVCTELYRKYGTVRAVAEETGLPQNKVSQYVKYDRLAPALKGLVDDNQVSMTAALKAQTAAEQLGEVDDAELVEMAKEMTSMSGAQQSRVIEQLAESPASSIDKVLEDAKSGRKVTQIVVTLTARVHASLQQAARDDGTNQDAEAGQLIEEALIQRGLLDG